MVNREIASPFADRAPLGAPTILHPALRHERAPYRYVAVTPDHTLVKLHRRHVADVRRCPAGGWDLYAVAQPALAIAWAGTRSAMRVLAPEALAAQLAAHPGCYRWCVLRLGKVAAYARPLPGTEAA